MDGAFDDLMMVIALVLGILISISALRRASSRKIVSLSESDLEHWSMKLASSAKNKLLIRYPALN